jgi:branched-subunit amino acid ABC-type transport system permease component
LAVLSAGLVGYLINQIIYKPFRKIKASNSILLIASLGVLILLESLLLIIFGANVQTIDYIANAQGLSFLGAIITPLQIIIIISSVILFIFFYFFMKKSRIGKAMRAVSDNAEVAEIVGISPSKIYAWSFVIGSMVAGIAAILISLEQNIEPSMGTGLMIKGFTGAVIGGLGSVPGAILGAFLLGFAENFGIWYLPSGYKDAIAFVLLFLFLLFRPNGILGIKYSNQK